MNDQALKQQIVEALQQDCETLPAHLRSRLNQARQQALDEATASTRRRHGLRFALPAGLATACTLVLAVWLAQPGPSEQAPAAGSPLAAEDLQLLAEPADLELIEELEFYAWLEQVNAGTS